MRGSKAVRLAVAVAAALAVALSATPAGAQAGSVMVARFAGTATVKPSIGLLGVPEAVFPTPSGPWTWEFHNDDGACNAVGVSGGTPAQGDCRLQGGGPLREDPDLTAVNEGKPKCGNSTGFTEGTATFSDPAGRTWLGEVHWDGLLRGDPSFSLGSWLLLFGSMRSDAGTAQVIQFLNATGSPQCNPLTNPNWPGESKFTVNGVMLVLG